jgi:archaemetzincin
MNIRNITFISFGSFDISFLEPIAQKVETSLFSKTQIKNANIDLSDFYDLKRNQYNANSILKHIENRFSNDTGKTIGLLNVDLFIPIFTYIFGQAYFNGKTGIASAFRLRNERYGLKPDKNIFFNRFIKEIIHELGHMFGLYHCYMPDCVMRSSTYVEDIDQKSMELCKSCKDLFKQNSQ